MGVLRVLVVDDEPAIRTSIARSLTDRELRVPDDPEPYRFELIEAGSGELALDLIDSQRPDIAFLDLMMPGLSGLEVLERLEGRCDMLSVLVTAFASVETAVAATRRGAWDVLTKPFTSDEVLSVARRGAEHLLARRRAASLARERTSVRWMLVRELAHELNTPLQALRGYLELLNERSLGDELDAYDDFVKRMLGRALTLQKIIEDMAALTRLEAGAKVRRIERLEARELALAAVEALRGQLEARRIAVELHCDGHASVLGDRTDLDNVLNNLVSNAVKYNREGGRIDVFLRGEPGALVVRVVDTGVGIDLEDQGRVFDEFYRVRTAATDGVTGSGLGLAIVKRVATEYDGEVSVQSRPGAGSTFTAVLRDRPLAG